MKKKIFFIMSTDDYSGAEAVNISIIEELKNKYDFYWVSRRGNINNYLKKNNIKWIEINKLSIKEIRRVVKEYNPELLHATDFKASLISSFSSMGKPVISHIHNNPLWLRKINARSLIFLIIALKVKKIITVSDSIKNEFIFSNIIGKKIACLYNPISRNKIISKINDNKEHEIKYDICCVARITEQKNPKRFVDIIKKLKTNNSAIRAVWVGDGELKKYIFEYVKNEGLEENIKFVGFQDNPFQYMYQSKIFMLTSDWEGFGLVAFEALCLGLPCVVSNVGGLPVIVDDGCGLLCDTSSINDYVDEIQKLLNDDKYYNYKHKMSIQKSKNLDNITKYMAKLEEIYNEVI